MSARITPSLLVVVLSLSFLSTGCDEEKVRQLFEALDAGSASKGRVGAIESGHPATEYKSFLASPGGRAWALSHMNEGGRTKPSPALAAAIDSRTFSADSFTAEAPSGDWSVAPPAREAALPKPVALRDLVLTAAAEPGMDAALLALLTGDPIGDFALLAAPPEPEDGPHLFIPEGWPPVDATRFGIATPPAPRPGGRPAVGATDLAGRAPAGSVAGESVYEADLSSPNAAAGGPALDLRFENDDLQLVRYACCDGVSVMADATADAPVLGELAESQVVWLLDLLPSTGLTSAFDDVAGCASSPGGCRSVVTQLSGQSNLTYFAEIFVPDWGTTGYAPLQSLFVRQVTETPGSAVLEVGYGRIARALEDGIEETVDGPGCGGPNVSVEVSAASADLYYDPSAKSSTYCDAAVECPRWRLVSCEDLSEGDEGFERCIFHSVNECGGAADPDREPDSEHGACVRNACRGKSTCLSCRDWFEQTGQDDTGWRTETDLVDACVQDLLASQPDGDMPLECLGGQGPVCVDYCQIALQTWNVNACRRYVAPYDTRHFADPEGYQCGELPVGETHPSYWYYANIGEWSGDPDYDWKRLDSFELFGLPHSFELGRRDSQRPIDFWTPDLGSGGARHESLGADVEPASFWFSLEPGILEREVVEAFDEGVAAGYEGDRAALFLNACVHLPGVDLRGPNNDYAPTDTPFWLIDAIDFGSGSVGRTDLCGFGAATLEPSHEPDLLWLDASLKLDDISYGGIEVNKGPGFWLIAAATKIVPVIGEILFHLVVTGALFEEIAEFAIDETDIDSWFTQFLLRVYEADVVERVVDELNDTTTSALAKFEARAEERLGEICDELEPDVDPDHPYYYFYRYLAAQCDDAVAEHALAPFQANQASEELGCYGEEKFFTPDDAGQDVWWQEYYGQEWYFWFLPDSGCRVGNRVEADLDEATWPVLRCAVATYNAWHNNGLIVHEGETTSGLGHFEARSLEPSVEQQIEELGELGYMVKANCSSAGHFALTNLYGDGQDLAELWREKHGDDPEFGAND